MTELERRILDISYKHKLSHIGSCLTSVGIIDVIYSKKKPVEKFVLSCGHAGLALYVVLEKYFGTDPEIMIQKSGIHPERLDFPEWIDCSTGSLGQGLPIALGMAMADRSKNVYCLISDGEITEGSIYEVMNIKSKYKVDNLIVYCNHNGWGAYDKTELYPQKFSAIKYWDNRDHWFIERYKQEAHYKVLREVDYEEAIRH
jgi:transketolase